MSHRISKLVFWLGGHELVVLLGLLIITGGTFLFTALASQVLEGDTQAFDEWVVRALRNPDDRSVPIGPHWMLEIVRDLTALGGIAVLTLVTLAVTGFLWLDRKYAAMWFVLAAVVSGHLISVSLKAIISRPRPDVVPHLSAAMSTSFPSGHSMMSAVVYLTLGALLTKLVVSRPLKAYFLTLAVFLTVLVGCSRVYMGVHYPTDVLSGWTAGLVWATLCWLVARSLQRRGKIEQRL